MAAVPSCSMESRLTSPMVVGPFSPAMCSGAVVESGSAVSVLDAAAEVLWLGAAVLEAAEPALPPQAARHSARLHANSSETIFFIGYSFSHPVYERKPVFFEKFCKIICFARSSLL